MAATTLTLVCLISGELTSKAFKVRIRDIHADISDLKKAIVGEKPNAFKHIDAKDLMLWQATIPADENAEEKIIITLDGLDHKTKLGNPRTCLSKLFPETPDDNTYIIVERPKGMPKKTLVLNTLLLLGFHNFHNFYAKYFVFLRD